MVGHDLAHDAIGGQPAQLHPDRVEVAAGARRKHRHHRAGRGETGRSAGGLQESATVEGLRHDGGSLSFDL